MNLFYPGGPRLSCMVGLLGLALLPGCASHAPDLKKIQAGMSEADRRDLTPPYFDKDVNAVCDPPIGWKPEPLKYSSQHAHQVWVSPTGDTAYGVIHFSLPLPVGVALALQGFIAGMKKSEGDAILISKADDSNLPGIRFVADGGLYRIRANLLVDGWNGWAIYAGSLRKSIVNADELDTAIRAHEHTKIGRPASSGT